MQSRWLAVIMGLCLSLSMACSKSSDTATESETTTSEGTKKAAVETKPAVVPAGTLLTVRLGETLGSKVSSPGQSFTATLAKPVVIDGTTVLADGASAEGTVVDAKPMGKFKGGALLQLKLTSVSDQPIHTASFTQTLKGKGKRSAAMIGGGAGLGAIIGGIAGGGKGAAIGAAAGAGAGTGGAVLTGNKEIVLPAETAVSFKLSEALTIK